MLHVALALFVSTISLEESDAGDQQQPEIACVEAIYKYWFEQTSQPIDSTLPECASTYEEARSTQLARTILLKNKANFGYGTQLAQDCARAYQHILDRLVKTPSKICGEAKPSHSALQASAVAKCNIDQGIINTVFNNVRAGEINQSFVKMCPQSMPMAFALNGIIRQENIEFIKSTGMDREIPLTWGQSEELMRVLYLMVFHADMDIDFQQNMAKMFEPYAGKTLAKEFFDNLIARIKAK